MSGYSLAAVDTITVTEVEGCWLGHGDNISNSSSAATAVDPFLSGLVFS